MFKNLDNDNDIEIGHMCNGRTFREVPLVNLFEQSHEQTQEEGFYNGEEEELLNEEHLEFGRDEKGKTQEPLREESQTSGTAHIVEVSIITPPIILEASSNQSNQSRQSA